MNMQWYWTVCLRFFFHISFSLQILKILYTNQKRYDFLVLFFFCNLFLGALILLIAIISYYLIKNYGVEWRFHISIATVCMAFFKIKCKRFSSDSEKCQTGHCVYVLFYSFHHTFLFHRKTNISIATAEPISIPYLQDV